MAASLIDTALLADASYDFDKPIANQQSKPPAGWTQIEQKTDVNGFQAVAYKNTNGDIVIAYRGTDELKDVFTDLQLPFGQSNQYTAAREFFQQVSDANQGATISLTGHSLGGALAQLVGAATGKDTFAFNAPGVANLLPSVLAPNDTRTAADFTNINNHNLLMDAISTWGTQLGNQTNYAPTPSETLSFFVSGATLLSGGTLAGLSALFGIKDTLDQHFMDRMIAALCMPTDPNTIDGWIHDDETGGWYKPALDGGSPPEWAGSAQAQALDVQRQTVLDNNVIAAQNYRRWHDTNPTAAEPWSAKFSKILEGLLGISSAEAAELNISDKTSTNFTASRAWYQKVDPLTLDLDGDGLETVGIDAANPILFDHDGDGIKSATGWIKPDDGFLVFDRDGNGQIDSGAELFGDSTPLFDADGVKIGKAADGFDALANQDTNGDGIVNAADAHWANLRVWQDADSDAQVDAGELKTLESLGIAGFHVARSENSVTLPNGNEVADLGSYIKTDGSEATLGNVTGGMADINLADNPFYRTFPDTLDTSAVASLPDMQGSGSLRDLREAATLSPALVAAIEAYAAADTRVGQFAQLDALLIAWAATGSFDTSIEQAAAQGFALGYRAPDGTDLSALVTLLETFNGMDFVQVEAGGVRSGAGGWRDATNGTLNFTLSLTQMSFLQQAYASLRQSVYDGLVLQTRLKPYLDDIALSIDTGDNGGISLDFAAMEARLEARFAADGGNANGQSRLREHGGCANEAWRLAA